VAWKSNFVDSRLATRNVEGAFCISEYGEIKAIGMQYFLKLSPAT
jgi:hypothetical protein